LVKPDRHRYSKGYDIYIIQMDKC
jgi:hypothetical protein